MDSISKKHVENAKIQMGLMLSLFLLTFFVAVFALGLGSSENLSFFSTLKIIFGFEQANKMESAIIWELRFPRILMAIVGGARIFP